MSDTNRTLMLQVKADIEVARTQLQSLVGVMGKTALEVDGNIGRIEDSFAHANTAVIATSKSLGIAGVAVGSFFGAFASTVVSQIPGALIDITRNAIETGSSIQDVAESLGISTDALQNFRIGASNAGVDVKRADSALEAFTKTTGRAATGNKAAAAAFSSIGVDIADSNGKLKPFDELLGAVADGLAKLPDPASRAAAATKLFSDAGVDLLPFLSTGSKGMNDLAAASEALGLKLSPETIAKLGDLGNKSEQIKQIMTAQLAASIGQNAEALFFLEEGALAAVNGLGRFLTRLQGFKRIVETEGLVAALATNDPTKFATASKDGAREYLVQQVGRKTMELQKAKGARDRNGVFDQIGDGAQPQIAKLEYELRQAEAQLAQFDTANGPRSRKEKPAPARPGGQVTEPPGPKGKPEKAAKPPKRVFSDAELRMGFDKLEPQVPMLAEFEAALPQFQSMNDLLGEISVKIGDVSQMDVFDPQAVAVGEQFLSDMSMGLASIITQGGDFGDMLVGSLARIGEAMLQSGILSLLSGGTTGSLFGTIFGGITKLPGFADGGNPPVGVPYLVGERGPELRIDRTPGTIIPNHALRAVGGSGRGSQPVTNNHYDLRGAMVTEDVMATINARSVQAAQAGALAGSAMAEEKIARRARRRL